MTTSTGQQTRSSTETTEYAAMLRRMARAYGRRLADGDPSDLAEACALLAELQATVNAAAREMHTVHGFSWQQIANETGTTRQGAYQRFTRDAPRRGRLAIGSDRVFYDEPLPLEGSALQP